MRESFRLALPLAIGIRSPTEHTIYIYAQSSHQKAHGTQIRQSGRSASARG
jgi:hypothetical protein